MQRYVSLSKWIKRNDFTSTRWTESLGITGNPEHPSNFTGQIKNSVSAPQCNLTFYGRFIITATFFIFRGETPVHLL